MREVSVQREDEEEQEGSDVFEMSFFEDLKVHVHTCTYTVEPL